MCRWLHATFGLTPADARACDNYALLFAAKYGHLAVCQWLQATYGLTIADARSDDNYAMRWAAGNGHLGVCLWLHATFGLTAADWEPFLSIAKMSVAAWIATLT